MVEHPERLAARLAALPPRPPLQQICRGAVAFLGVDAAAVVLMSDGDTGTIASSYGSGVATVQDLQFALGEGPCLTAFTTGVAVLVADVARNGERWPVFAAAAAKAGVCAVFVVPLEIGAIRLGVLYLTRHEAGALPDSGLGDIEGLAQLATTIVLEQQLESPDVVSVRNTEAGWSHRSVVHQATGMISAQLDIGLADALARLRGHAYSNDRSIYDVAADVVDRRMRFTAAGGTP
jgi:transcriptional regulator with GAF, ATPase, and Fis domain